MIFLLYLVFNILCYIQKKYYFRKYIIILLSVILAMLMPIEKQERD